MGSLDEDTAVRNVPMFGGLVLLAGAMLAALSVFTALLPVDLGVWPRFEPGAMALYFSAAICGIGLLLVWREDKSCVEQAVSHPFVLAALFVFLLSIALAPTSDYPWLSILGYPLIGEGAMRFAAMAVLFAAAMVLRQDRRLLFWLLATLLVASIGASLAFHTWARSGFVSLDVLGITVVSAWIAAWYLVPERHRRWRPIASLNAILPVLIFSANLTAIVMIVVVALPVMLLVRLLLQRFGVSLNHVRAMVVAALFASPFVGFGAVWLIPEITDFLPSVTSRKYNFQVLLAALQDDPTIILWGTGWGEISMVTDRFRTFSDAILWDGSWDGYERDIPHTHNWFLEALFGAGLLAGLGTMAMLAAPIVNVEASRLMPAIFATFLFAGFTMMWPQVAMTVGMVALSIGVCSGQPALPRLQMRTGRPVVLGLPVIVAILLSTGSWLVDEGTSYRRQIVDVRTVGPGSPHSCALHSNSPVYGDLDLTQGFVQTYRAVFRDSQSEIEIPLDDLRLVDAYLCSMGRRQASSESPSLYLALESFRSQVSSDSIPVWLRQRYQASLEGWHVGLTQLLNVAPKRKDMTTGFFLHHMGSGNWRTVESLARALVASDPRDPIGHWFLGLSLAVKGDRGSQAESDQLLRRSLELGIEKILPVSSDFRKQLLKKQAE
ncbi:MAG: hypothetical protein CL566_09390 [Alphaproteobacteria bacterium]|nr:hypothetical protein [Alphaproteobacteria bacterium]|tara:strand:- start:1327 stop:3318 length:1992 start_codon:yes stop_codon:yes gene_type:complete